LPGSAAAESAAAIVLSMLRRLNVARICGC
jgi:hypothetical protein